MAFTAGFSVNVGDPTKASDVDVLAANDDYLKNAIDTFIANDANNRVLTGTGSGTANAETNLTFDGSTLTVTGTVSATTFSGNVTGGTISGTTGTFSGDLAVDTDTLYVDASADRVGINNASPAAPLHLIGSNGDPSAAHSGSAQLIVENNSTAFIEIATTTGDYAGLTFSDDAATRGGVLYDHGSTLAGGADSLNFQTAGSVRANINSTGSLTLQTNQGAETALEIYNTYSTSSAKASLKVGYDSSDHLHIYRQGNLAGIFYNATQSGSSHQFQIAGSAKATLDGTGLGIGTTSPTYLLDVSNAGGTQYVAHFRNTTNTSPYTVLIEEPSSASVGYPLLKVGSSSTERFRVDTGAVTTRLDATGLGIGTSSPSALLHLYKSGSTQAGLIETDQSASVLNFKSTGQTAGQPQVGCSGSNLILNTNGTERTRIDSSGHLGLRVAPNSNWSAGNATLQIGAQGALWSPVSAGTGNAVSLSANGYWTGSLWKYITTGDYAAQYYQYQGGHYFRSASASGTADADISFSNVLTVLNDGKTGIGTSSPSGRLHVEGGGIYHIGSSLKYIASSSVQSISSTNNAGAELTTDAYLWINRSSAPCVFLNRTTTTGQIAVFYSDLTAVGSISVTASATAYNTSSDYRLKENLAPITGAVDRVNALKPWRFNFIAEPDKVVDGFVAHEVSSVVPEAITGEKDAVDADGNPEYQGIDQSKLVPLLTAAIQELTARIEALEAA